MKGDQLIKPNNLTNPTDSANQGLIGQAAHVDGMIYIVNRGMNENSKENNLICKSASLFGNTGFYDMFHDLLNTNTEVKIINCQEEIPEEVRLFKEVL